MKFRVRTPFLAVRDEPDRQFAFTTIPQGTVIVTDGVVNKSGLVDVEYDGHTFAAFLRDIQERCEKVRGMPD